MNVGILTFHHVYNYGAVLQAYSLRSYIKALGHRCEIVDYRPFSRPVPSPNFHDSFSRRMYRIRRKLGFSEKSEKQRKFDMFRCQYLGVPAGGSGLSRKKFISATAALDALVVGSDQVWDPRFGARAQECYFLKRVPEAVRKISYAACAGSTVSNLSLIERYSEELKSFQSISVRDDFTRDSISNFVDQSVHEVVDPSLLVNWRAEVGQSERLVEGDYAFYYGFSANGNAAAARVRSELGLKIVGAGMETGGDIPDYVEQLSGVGPLDWVSLVYHSKYVITKSFHGMMFAIKFRKPFIVVPENMRALARLEDAGARFGVSERVLRPNQGVSDVAIMDDEHALDGMDSVIDARIRVSEKFLANALR